ncbi:MAG TPA: hypothetical protein VIH82_14690 [Acidimicrobiia bacterium]
MRKIALIAMLAIVGAMVPMSTASTTPLPGTLDGVGTLMTINPGTTHKVLFIKNEGEFRSYDMPGPSQQEIQVTQGDHTFVICNFVGTFAPIDETCATAVSPPVVPFGTGTVHVESNDILNAIVTGTNGIQGPPSNFDVQENDDHQTETDHAKLTMFNYTLGAFDACVGGEHVISLPAQAVGGSAPFQVAEFDSKDGEGQDFLLYPAALGKPFIPGCGLGSGASAAIVLDQGFPTGSNLVINFTGIVGGNCGSNCGYLIFPGEEPPSSSQNVDEFCKVVLEAANITGWLQDLFAEVEVGNPDTYPSKEKVEKVITRIAELLERGTQTAPADIKPAWLAATAAFVQTGQFAAAEYDLNQLSQDDLRDAVSLIDNPQADDEEAQAAIDALTAWVPVNCFGAVETEPSFTG